ncbi:hypothetical protein [Pseudooctadecabacter jejudonensis]|uniref:Uncharacterized protein n=1 Tax=Pseudooctadecabacter jejudonensis TaxID=1391910 RepID=A0A1Y5SQ84_9RHOB|nr:hypothetical protein [Pseudooctadecabacter jejudonensis]SLN45256.1 hypothetical protein PSJ8397_02365 [Pseudooctadecabacter jejudonensis]
MTPPRVMICAAALCAMLTPPATAQSFAIDVPHADAMRALGANLLMDTPVGEPAYISAYSFCDQGGTLMALGQSPLEDDTYLIGLVQVIRAPDNTVAVSIPTSTAYPDLHDHDHEDHADPLHDGLDLEGLDTFAALAGLGDIDTAADERRLVLQSMISAIPCDDWGQLARVPTSLFAVKTIDGHTSLSALLTDVAPPTPRDDHDHDHTD